LKKLLKQQGNQKCGKQKEGNNFILAPLNQHFVIKEVKWRKAASGFSKITTWFPNEISDNTNNYKLFFDKAIDSSDDDDNKFTLVSLDALIKKNSKDVRLRTVSQFLHLIQDQGFLKLSASGLLARSVNRGPWHAQIICSWANQ
jgi:hypothetical protein